MAAREYGYALALVGIAGAVAGWRSSRCDRIACAVGALGAAVLAIPLVEASKLARNLPKDLTEAFGTPRHDQLGGAKPVQVTRLARAFTRLFASKQITRTVVFSSPGGLDLKLDLYCHPEKKGVAPH